MKFAGGMLLVAVVASIFLGAASGYAQTQPTSITISPQNPTLTVGQTQQFTALSGSPLDFGESTAVAAGREHTCALLASGAVKCWGLNSYGQLGAGAEIGVDSPVPVAVKNLSSAVAITAGLDHTCALLASGTAKCWGRNNHGQLGDGSKSDSTTPAAVSGLTGAVAISAGGDHTCALLSNGTAECWGDNSHGQLGDGSKTESTTPVAVSGLGGAVAITAGNYHTCALLSNGTAKCWGDNSHGQLGDGTNKESTTPVVVSGLTGAMTITTAVNQTCALLSNGTAKCWGDNSHGQLGDGTKTDRPSPVAVSGLSGAVAIVAGGFHTCALLSSGTAMCWGWNFAGELGDGTQVDSYVPVPVKSLTGAVTMAAGFYHTCAVLSNGTVTCWGRNISGILGNGIYDASFVPATVTGQNELPGRGSTDISAGLSHTCTLLSDGTAKCWGANDEGQLGNGNRNPSWTPVAVLAGPNTNNHLTGAVAIAAGEGHTCALLSSGTVKCWGNDYEGQLGVAGPAYSTTPLAVSGVAGVVAIATGRYYSCALLASGMVKCWGADGSGQLGNGTTQDHHTAPVTVLAGANTSAALSGVVAIAAGASHTCALLASGMVKCWGADGSGQLGNGKMTTASSTPVGVTGLSTAVAIAAGASHTCALLSGGTVKCWGYNYYGQLGNGSRTASSTPVAVSGLTGAVAIAAALGHTCAVLANGRAKCWGWNDYGQLGDGLGVGPDVFLLTPVSVQNLTGAVTITAREEHTCALLASGTVMCWGYNKYGQLGDGTDISRRAPVPTVALVPSLIWASSNGTVAGIGAASGLATAGSIGTTTITATYGTLKAQTTLNVP